MRTPHYRKKEDPCEMRWEDLCRKERGAKWCSSIKQNKGSYFTIQGSQHITKRFIHLKFLVQHISVMKVEELSVKQSPFLIVIIQILMVLMNSDGFYRLLSTKMRDGSWMYTFSQALHQNLKPWAAQAQSPDVTSHWNTNSFLQSGQRTY